MEFIHVGQHGSSIQVVIANLYVHATELFSLNYWVLVRF